MLITSFFVSLSPQVSVHQTHQPSGQFGPDLCPLGAIISRCAKISAQHAKNCSKVAVVVAANACAGELKPQQETTKNAICRLIDV